jgi:two-component system CheB/CheR fusion protein
MINEPINSVMSEVRPHAAVADSKNTFPIVGIGASAGGLEALKEFFSAVPAKCGMAFVVITHRDPEGINLLPEILSKYTSLPVTEASNGMQVEPGRVYISPPSDYLHLKKEKLVFEKMVRDGVRLPIDFFFRSLAGERGEKAICVLLSGNGSDGTLGLQAVKGEGGMAMAQDLESAQFGDMPRNAVATGMVDYVLPPDRMPEQLDQYISCLQRAPRAEAQPLLQSEAMDEILHVIRQHIGSDFSLYKSNTLGRRIERRMNVHHIQDPWEYVRYLHENTHEIALLFKELLIGVTSFFRDPAAFEALEKEALPELLAGKAAGDTVRFWSAGCSTGEEPYSLAILLHEYMEREKKPFNVQIFATDLDDNAVNLARTGLYSDGIALDVAPARLEKHFIKEDHHYRIRKNIREMVVFATQNLIQDPPFTKLDLISCRNLLIYLDARTQKKIIPLFHYALRPDGMLLLGSSEAIGAFTELFTPLHGRGKIFRRKEAPLSGRHLAKLMELPRTSDAGHRTEGMANMPKGGTPNISELAQRLLLSQHVPASLIVNDKGDIFFIHGRTGQYLELSPGQPQPQQNVLDMAREGLQLALAAIIRKAAAQEAVVTQRGVRIRIDDHSFTVTLRARKIADPEALRGLIWITFETEGDSAEPMPPQDEAALTESNQLERELQLIKQSLQNTIEEREAVNEHLKSVNEEMQSTNEELQSSNEELETAKEEMQSLNEELQTVNAELENKISDLSHANDDMTNLLNNTGIATVFLDNDLNIKRFTAPAKKIINLLPADIGRPVGDIVSQLEYKDLVRDAAAVMQTLVHKEREVRAQDWSWYLMRIMPYRTSENVIDGLVVTFVDITRLKKSEILLATNIRALEMISLKKAPLEKVLDEILFMIERQAQGIRCGVSLLDEKQSFLRFASGPSLPAGFVEALRELKTDSPMPCARTVRERKAVVMPDLTDDAGEFAALALKYDIKAAWAQPILSTENKVLGAFTVYYNHPHKPFFMEEELINQAVPLMGMALSRNEMEKKE